ncbi:MAG TPA: T9SS type A sorting domain-containing protein [Flavisolibacter sp.]|nr:T9SS type A sorting domain-containing protein [Flavisolibacter sp.]
MAQQFSLYPNPASQKVTIKAELTKPQAATIKLINMLGQVVSTVSLPINNKVNYQLPLNKLAKGIYVVQLETETGMQAQRLVIQ